jgi:hypothetical protein
MGKRDDRGGAPRAGDLAQGEVDPGKNGLAGDNDPGKNGAMAGGGGDDPFKNGVHHVKGDWALAVRMGAIEFCSFATALAWLDSPAGRYFQNRMDSVIVVATVGFAPDV